MKNNNTITVDISEIINQESFFVCCIQLRTPFWTETEKGEKDERLYFKWSDSALNSRHKKIFKILNDIEEKYIKREFNIKVIVFPEYSIENSIVSDLTDFSIRNNVIIIAGDYDSDSRNAFARIILPISGMEAVKQYKFSPSKYDKEYLSKIDNAEKKHYKLIWRNRGGEYDKFLKVFVCHDFLDSICDNMSEENPGLYIVIMTSPRIDEFYGLSYMVIRSRNDNKNNIVLLCNAAENPLKQKEKVKSISCGETQIICHSDRHGDDYILPKIGKYTEGGIIAEISLDGTDKRLTPIKYLPVIQNIKQFSINNIDGSIRTGKNENTTSESCVIINPNAIISLLGLKKIYALYCISNYSRIIGALQGLPLQSNTIFGVYDILIKSHEENYLFFQQRIKSHLGDKFSELIDSDPYLPRNMVFTVKSVLRYRGVDLAKIINGDIRYNSNYKDVKQDFIEDNILLIKKVMNGDNKNNENEKDFVEKENDLVSKSVLVRARCDSDVFPEDDAGCEEYLIFVKIYHTNAKSRDNTNKDFRKHILTNLMNNKRVRTVELCSDDAEGEIGYDWDYIIHFVGELVDLRRIIINEIHEKTRDIDIRCRTFVVIAAGKVNNDKHDYLSETIIREPMSIGFVLDMIGYLKHVDPKNPFIIKKVSVDVIKNLSKSYIDYKKIIDYESDSANSRANSLNKFNNFVYGLCWAYVNDKYIDKEVFEKIHDWCLDTYVFIAKKIESHLDDQKELIKKEIILRSKDEELNIYLNRTVTKSKKIKDILDSEQTIMGDLHKVVYYWKSKFDTDIKSVEYIEKLKKIESVAPFRNFFSHKHKANLNIKKTKEFSVELIVNFTDAVDFVRRYCK